MYLCISIHKYTQAPEESITSPEPGVSAGSKWSEAGAGHSMLLPLEEQQVLCPLSRSHGSFVVACFEAESY